MRNFLTRNLHLNSRSYLKFIWLFFLAISPLASWGQSVYYVAPDGDDSGSGSFNNPWATWEKAFTSSQVQPGDTVYFRGGTYYLGSQEAYGPETTRSGTSSAPIYYLNYPNEKPILDGDLVEVDIYNQRRGVQIHDISNVIFRGLTVRNIEQIDGETDTPVGWHISDISNVTFDQCNAHNIWGIGFKNIRSNNIYYLNCDAYDCTDWITSIPASNPVPGNDGTGFQDFNMTYSSYTVTYENCRAWRCGDQGFSSGSIGQTVYDGCWSWSNGVLEGGGHGFKMGWVSTVDRNITNRIYKNCISAYNRNRGWDSNDQGYDCGSFLVYNNIAYQNAEGFRVFNTGDTYANELKRVYRNNIAFDNTSRDEAISSSAAYTHSNNSWDTDVTVTDADFISVDSTGLSSTRNSDGSLPDLNGFLELANGSDLIDAGVNVGLDYYGSNPDLGYYEYQPEDTSDDITIQIKIVKTFPNPTRDLLAIQFYCQEAGTIPLTVTDETGTTVLTQNISANEDINKIVLDFSTFDNGTYKVTLNYNDAEVSTIIYKNDLL